MVLTVKVAVLIVAFLGGLVIITSPKGQNRSIQTCSVNDSEERLREKAQNALADIGSKRVLHPSKKRAARGQHVFNNGLLGFHRSVLQELLRDVGGYDEQLDNLMQDLVVPLRNTQQTAIETMVAHFSSNEHYVDYNADLYGEFVKELRDALVRYLKAETSESQNERYEIWKKRQRVHFIATQMVNHEVYVDPMARDRCLQEHLRPQDEQLYNQVRDALKIRFQDILQDFRRVSDKIRVFRKRKNWSWDK